MAFVPPGHIVDIFVVVVVVVVETNISMTLSAYIRIICIYKVLFGTFTFSRIAYVFNNKYYSYIYLYVVINDGLFSNVIYLYIKRNIRCNRKYKRIQHYMYVIINPPKTNLPFFAIYTLRK